MKVLYFKQKRKVLYLLYYILFFPFSIANAQTNVQNENFKEFIYEFTHDTVFQISRVKFPLTYAAWDIEKDKEYSVLIKKEHYRFSILYFELMNNGDDAYTVFYDNFACKFRETGEMVFQWKGFTDMDVRYYFKRINGKWYLVKIFNADGIDPRWLGK